MLLDLHVARQARSRPGRAKSSTQSARHSRPRLQAPTGVANSRNGDHVIGLFQGMFDKNMLTFNPGWDQNAQAMATFTDVRALQRQLKAQGVPLMNEADESTTGPASSSD